jgi:ABC-type nitrate/sulfonate/bicarbonate transport system substrate-binding protein
VAGAAATAVTAARAAALAQATTTLRVASTAVDDVAPALWAMHTGAFTKAGLTINLTRMNAGAQVTAAVIGGALDIGKSSLLPLISAHAQGLPVMIIAPGQQWDPNSAISGLIVLKDGPLVTARDLNGKTIATAGIKDLSWVATRAWLDAHGGDSKTVKFLELPQYAMFGALGEGRVDAATITAPSFSAAMASGKVRDLGSMDEAIAKHFLTTAWFATSDFIAKNPSVVARFADVIERSAAYANTHASDTLAMVADFAGFDPAALAHMPRGDYGIKLETSAIQPLIDAAVKYEIIPRGFDAQEMLAKTS